MPPRHGKTQLASILFPIWFLGNNPDSRIMLISYAATLAERNSRQAKDIVQSEAYQSIFPSVKLSPGSQSVEEWDVLGHRGGVQAAGVGGPITGRGFHLGIIDDPIKNREEADSDVIREKVWDWYTSTFYTRGEPNPEDAAIIVIQTRWHEDDLTGRLLQTGREGEWEVIYMPAVDETGNGLWPERFPDDTYTLIQEAVGQRDWEALYQGRPAPLEGGLFKRKWFAPYPYAPERIRWVRFWDLATTEKTSGDWTVGAKVGLDVTGAIWVADVLRVQWEWPKVRDLIEQTSMADGPNCSVIVEKTGFQSAAIQDLRQNRKIAAPLLPATPDKDKFSRALAWSARAAASGVCLLPGRWHDDLISECCLFPNGRHDDQVDAISGAFEHLYTFSQGATQSERPPIPFSAEYFDRKKRTEPAVRVFD